MNMGKEPDLKEAKRPGKDNQQEQLMWLPSEKQRPFISVQLFTFYCPQTVEW